MVEQKKRILARIIINWRKMGKEEELKQKEKRMKKNKNKSNFKSNDK